jgi:UDP-N-acetylmuramoylalanine--D-glutamate ligase
VTHDIDGTALLDAALSLEGRRVLVMGLGRLGGGVPATRFLVEQGAKVTVTDTSPAPVLSESVEALSDLDVRYRLGGHDKRDFSEADLVVANPAVPVASPFLDVARAHRVPITTEIGLFVAHCQSPVYAVTGTSGKTTTATMLGAMIQRRWKDAKVGGNMGISLLSEVGTIGEETPVVLEVSSFQLRHLGAMAWSPRVAVVTNFSPNHLDVHGSIDDYRTSKRMILANQTDQDVAVLNRDDAEVRAWTTSARKVWFGVSDQEGPRSDSDGPGVVAVGERIVADGDVLLGVADLRVPGRHNVANACAASAAALTVGVSIEDVTKVLQSFDGVEHRLERVGKVGGVTFVNDSVATSPDRTLVALDAVEGGIVLIAGGYDKGLPFDDLGMRIAERVRCLVLVGEAARSIQRALPGDSKTVVRHVTNFEEAVYAARDLARPGETVLLSPACASYGLFMNFEERGRRFKDLVDER